MKKKFRQQKEFRGMAEGEEKNSRISESRKEKNSTTIKRFKDRCGSQEKNSRAKYKMKTARKGKNLKNGGTKNNKRTVLAPINSMPPFPYPHGYISSGPYFSHFWISG
jgi:hypothetical protein